jgi:hypothetical protein
MVGENLAYATRLTMDPRLRGDDSVQAQARFAFIVLVPKQNSRQKNAQQCRAFFVCLLLSAYLTSINLISNCNAWLGPIARGARSAP